MKLPPVQFFNRYTQRIETEAIYGEGFLRWAYGNPLGRLSVSLFVKRPFFSSFYGWRMNRASTRHWIKPFIQRYGIDPDDFADPIESYRNFNDFFSRRLRTTSRPVDSDPAKACFPADGRHLGFDDLSAAPSVFVKGQEFDLIELFQSRDRAARYHRGSAVLSRLCPTDYHRFHFSTAGLACPATLINGSLYSVSPLALRQQLDYLWQNKRMVTEMTTPTLGQVTIVEFGATNVGSIHQTYLPDQHVDKGEEKGFFAFGGSATMTFFEPGRIQLASDLLDASRRGLELYARMGDFMGTAHPADQESLPG